MTPLVIVAHPSAGSKTLLGLIAKAKRELGTLGAGSSRRLAGTRLAHFACTEWIHVPYTGARLARKGARESCCDGSGCRVCRKSD